MPREGVHLQGTFIHDRLPVPFALDSDFAAAEGNEAAPVADMAVEQQNFEDEHGECVEIGHIEHVHDQAENGDDLKEG